MAQASIKIGASMSDYQAAMRQAVAEMKNLSSEYSLAAAQAKLYGTQADALRAKVTELTQKMDVQRQTVENNVTQTETLRDKLDKVKAKHEELKQKVDSLKTAYDASCEATGENSEETKRLKQELEKAEAQLAQNERQTGKLETAITNQEAATTQSRAALAQLEVQLRDVNAELARQKFDEYAEKANKVGDALTGVGQKMMVVTGAITAVAASSVKTTADFEAQMSKVGAISGATGEDFEKLTEKAKEMGAKTKFSASESAEALEYMAMAGWKTGDMLDGIEGIMNLAAASGENLGTTSDIVTDALTAFGLTAADSGHFADVLAQASASANTNVSMLGESFKYVAPVAGTFGYSAEDVAIALGLMANAGIKGSQAGTSLRSALTNMVKPTKDMVGVINKFGIEIENADGSMKPFKELMDDLREKFRITTDAEREQSYAMAEQQMIADGCGHMLEGLSGEQKKLAIAYSQGITVVEALSEKELKSQAKDRLGIELTKERKITEEEYYELAVSMGKDALEGLTEAKQAEAAATLFGKEAMSGMLNIINASDKDYQKLTESIYSCNGAAEDMAATMLDNLSGQVTILKSALEGVSITIGNILLPYIKEGVSWVQNLVDRFANLDERTQKVVVAVAAVVAAIGPLLLVIGKMITFSASVSSGLGTLSATLAKVGFGAASAGTSTGAFSTILAAITSPVGIAVAAVAALVAGLAYVAVTNEDVRASLIKIWNTFTENLQPILEYISDTVLPDLRVAWDSLLQMLQPLAKFVMGALTSAWQDILIPVLDWIAGTVLPNVLSTFKNLWENVLRPLGEFIGSVLTPIISFLADTFTMLWDIVLVPLADFLMTTVMAAWDGLYQVLNTYIIPNVNLVIEVFQWLWDNVMKPMVDWLMATLLPIFQTVFETVGDIFENLKTVFQGVIDFIVGVFTLDLTKAGEGIRGIFMGLWETIKSIFSGALEVIEQVLSAAWDRISSVVSTVWEGISSFFGNIWSTIYTTVSEWLNNVWQVVSSIFMSCWEVVESIWQAIQNVIQVAIMFIVELFSAAFELITAPFRFIWENCKDTVMSIWETIKTIISTAIEAVKTMLETVMNAIRTVLETIWNTISINITNVVNGIKNTVSSVFNAVKDTVSSIFNSVKSIVTSVWDGIKIAITIPINAVKATVSTVLNGIRSTVSSVFNSVKSTVTSVWDSIKNAIETPINTARDTVKNAIDKIKGFFNFSWSLPHLKLPHPTISGSFSLNPPSVPSFSIEWYKSGGIMTEPTLFGGNGTTLFAGGEAGDEAILPLAPFYTQLSAMLDSKFEQLKQSYQIQVTVITEMDGEVIAEKLTEPVSDNIVKEYERRR